jgi:broad-specificity NMP kinase
MKIYITGVSGVGKTSIANALKARGVNAVDIDEISHWENKASGETVDWEPGRGDAWQDAHVWICDTPKLKEVLTQTQNSVALGHASNQDEYLPLFDKVFVLSCKPETVIHRLNTRTNNDFGKYPEDQARILNWHKTFDSWMVEKGAEVMDGERPMEKIVEDVVSNFS